MKAIVVISDLHIGSTLGLCPEDGLQVSDGGCYLPNKFQTTLWKFWKDFWGDFVPRQVAGAESVTLVVNGDPVEGLHHQQTGIITNNLNFQEEGAIRVLNTIPTIIKFDHKYLVRGTEAHSEPGNQSDERLAKGTGCEKNEIGEYSSWQIWLEVNGVLIQFAHHISGTQSFAYESTAPMRELVAGLVESAQWGSKIPQIFVRSHRHRFIPVSIPYKNGRIWCIITAAWQLKTGFAEKIDRMRNPSIGGLVLKIGNEGEIDVREKLYPLPEIAPIRI
jgi:hypothetical protein